MDPMALHRNARLIGAYYRDRLARNLIARGYSIVPAIVERRARSAPIGAVTR